MWISRYFVYFIIFGFIGWVYETLFCTIKNARWDNRGVLYGPICPIYGVGGVSITAVTDILSSEPIAYDYTWWQVFLAAFLGSIVLEYATSLGLEILFHAYWWDYFDSPFNINGRVCLPCSLGFGVAGLVIVYLIAPFVKYITSWISPLGFEILGLVSMCLISIDAALTVSALTHFEKTVSILEESVNTHMEQFVGTVVDKAKSVATKGAWLPSAKELLAGEKQSIATKLTEEKERFSRESLDRLFQSMSASSKAALRKVRGFRKPQNMDTHYMDAALAQLKKYINKKK